MSNLDILSMSDEEFAKLPPPDASEAPKDAAPVEPVAEAPVAEPEKPEAEEAVEPKAEPVQEDTQKAETPPAEDKPVVPEPKVEAPPVVEPVAKPKEVTPPEPVAKVEAKADEEEESSKEDYKSFFDKVMAPFKANGKQVQLQSVEEVIQLMQMGANYTKKMQSIQQHKKYLMMLENNGLLDENKLSFYIDLEKKNPEAIKKFLKDSNIDPIELDTSGEVNYTGGSHTVTDQEATLASAIDDLNGKDGGKDTLQSVHGWDQASKKALWDNPELLAIIHAQRENGIYDRISSEIERRKLIGQVPAHAPFLQAYKSVGDELAARGAFQGVPQPATSVQPPVARTPVAVRPAKTSATKAVDNQKIRAAASTRSSSQPAKANVNVLAMSDEDFLKLAGKV